MSQYPKWFLAINFPNIIFAMAMMTFFMFGGVHPFGDVDSVFWSFIIYLFTQLLWIVPIVLSSSVSLPGDGRANVWPSAVVRQDGW